MNVLLVYCHLEPRSLTANMKNLAAQVLGSQNHDIVISDLYAQGFNAVAQKWDFVTTTGSHFNYASEQKHAAGLGMSFAPDITGELEKLAAAEIVLFFAPIWWSGMPALLKGWFDRVLAQGVAWDEHKIYNEGLLRGKQAMMITSAGLPPDYFREDGINNATTAQMLHGINHSTLAFCGFDVHEPYVATNLYAKDEAGNQKIMAELEYRLNNLLSSPNWLIKY